MVEPLIDVKEAKFNAALDKLQRIGDLSMSFHASFSAGNLRVATECLSSIYTELYEFFNADEIKDLDEYEIGLRKLTQTSAFTKEISPAAYHTFLRKLNKLQYKYGLSMPAKEIQENKSDEE